MRVETVAQVLSPTRMESTILQLEREERYSTKNMTPKVLNLASCNGGASW